MLIFNVRTETVNARGETQNRFAAPASHLFITLRRRRYRSVIEKSGTVNGDVADFAVEAFMLGKTTPKCAVGRPDIFLE